MFAKHKRFFGELEHYLGKCAETLEKFQGAILYSIKNGVDERYQVLANEISELEQDCDEIRRSIEETLFSESLLPETREDIFEIIERMDHIPNHCESVCYMILDQNSSISAAIHEDLTELLGICVTIFDQVREATMDCLGKMTKIRDLMLAIDNNKNLSYELKRKMIRAIFAEKDLLTHPGGQLAQKEIVVKIEEICSRCKHLSEKINLTAIKRRV